MEPEVLSSANWRGFHASYKLAGGRLLHRELSLREKHGRYVPIDDVQPELSLYEGRASSGTYYNLSMPVPFTGKIRLVKDFIGTLYIHMGFQKPTAFKTVLDMTF